MIKLFLLVCFSVNVLVGSIPLDQTAFESRIIGGNDTDISKVPYMVGQFSHNTLMCGGVIISPTFIATAGMCLIGEEASDVVIRAGSSRVFEGGVLIKAKKLYIHPKYDTKTFDYDIGLIELETPIKFNNKTIMPIKLTSKEPSADSTVLASGWGRVNTNLDVPETLQSISIPVVDRTKCANLYKSHGMVINPRMMCAGFLGNNIYFGDYGGPLAYKNELVGIISFGMEFGIQLPGVFTNIANPEITKFIKTIAKL